MEGLPGTVAQLVLLPPVIHLLGKIRGPYQNSEEVISVEQKGVPAKKTTEAIAQAKQMIQGDVCSFVVIKEGRIIYQDRGNGVKPIMKLLDADRTILKDAVVVDKLIGKAAALLLCLGEVSQIHAITMSEAGREYLKQAGIYAECEKCIGMISNRKKDGICPLERAVCDIWDPQSAYEILKKTIADLMKSAG